MEVPIIESTFVLSGRVRKRHYISQRKTMKKLVPATVKIMTLVIPTIVKMATILEKKNRYGNANVPTENVSKFISKVPAPNFGSYIRCSLKKMTMDNLL